ncbi:NAD-dependent epimerase/dehydratase family protein [Mycobacterium mantenii]|nr:NAD-dependent epimerase/dehydratase family protein [Mycobacterium mantenii]MCV7246624.1 NAD-dependent epimerase/dehydratase family protein [Mycobacterium mantenii]ORB06733.1 epimerase [Mycobacterium mantenii]
MKVAVTGPAGYVGVNLVRLLIERGNHVVAIDLKDSNRISHHNLTTVRADILDAAAMRTALDGVEVVFHLAAVITMARRDDTAWRINTEGVRSVAEAALGTGVRRMVLCSSLNAFDPRNQEGPVDECTQRSTASDLPLYDRSKWQGECEFSSVVERGLDGVIVNPTGVVGPVDYGPVRLNRMLLEAARGRMLVAIGGGFDMVDVRDVASGLCAAAEHGRTGENYILGGHFVSFIDAFRIAAACTGRRGPLVALPLPVLKRCAPLLDTLGTWLRRDMLGAAMIATLVNAPRVDGAKARSELGHRPRDTETAIADLVSFFQHIGRLPTPRKVRTTADQVAPPYDR